ncbi:MAG TPA: ABC transporter permease, partial [Magnetospirillaceae bacterium]|nr:ABC transporter permease [Magnetospirillaceae bacterium]
MNRVGLARRLLQAVLTVMGVLVINFLLFRVMPGDPVSMRVRDPRMDAESRARLERMLGLDRPAHEQFFRYARDLARGDLGTSFIYREPVLVVMAERLPATLLLTMTAEVLAVALGMGLGILAAWKRGTVVDYGALGFALVMYSMPTFWLSILMVAVFSGALGLFPV